MIRGAQSGVFGGHARLAAPSLAAVQIHCGWTNGSHWTGEHSRQLLESGQKKLAGLAGGSLVGTALKDMPSCRIAGPPQATPPLIGSEERREGMNTKVKQEF